MVFPFGILRRWFTEPHVMCLWLWLIVANMSLKSGTPTFFRELQTNRTYLPIYILWNWQFFSILVSKNKWLVLAVGGWKLVIWSAFCWSFKSFLECWLFWYWPPPPPLPSQAGFTNIYQMRIKNRYIIGT